MTVVAAGVATVLLVWWILLMPTLQELYIREFVLPRIAQRHGFEFGTVTFSRDNVSYSWAGFVNVNSDGELARVGVRRRDVLFQRHGYGATALYSALEASEHGHVGEFEVVNADDWSAGLGQSTVRTIRVPPQGTRR